ncbi:ComF family protein [Acinetobacter sp. MD2(2019)]|uniref:ComF family protein n=1 Tax=Acinetobacter sp. MD2(2019) TaxID=2605273 RepID=UPI002D1EBEC4|nr:phosphoribosyltransferase family protein [Acinetobacter sp. MD2(2019)]MEB3754678.1 ComF family protein [Acinetobacter sp. MD2(2019)]
MRIFKLVQALQGILRIHLPCKLCQSAKVDIQRTLCKDCWQQLPWQRHHAEHENFHLQVACHYSYPLNRMIQQFKYEQQLHYLPLLSQLLRSLQLPKVQAIVAMPVSPQRLAERGYNQSLLLAQQLAAHLNLPIWQPVSRKNEHAQKGLSGVERRQHIDQQFYIAQKPKLRFRRVLIIDDVITTGSSLDALAKQLKQLGCTEIHAACLAIAN